mmetsp:Transcript_23083/g.48107  ORF Transcript_23083/g.48107 Transcript_23083/m.48107 type:complete len:143 (-) Transcript_23083:58-486(-)|eukprot:CAMPEP_0172456034 /NCGR_PEP_ID=MMETSP1065-20121228/13831_1 /TAXON_ID=265537 /ORGANISM="Amphiprora paludosa, Strain CCMP125" /LENGTH=142 /DNA_ID=CAMNT_0013208651 /DNA_START=55 /DNA_END=483 /DNA_ORIENTATION=+
MDSSKVEYTKLFLGFVGLGAGLPAVALVLGFPDSICDGLGRGPHKIWKQSKEATFGLHLYTVSDIALATLIGSCLLASSDDSNCPSPKVPAGSISTITLALGATAAHQLMYLAAAIPTFGFCKEHVASIVVGSVAGIMAWRR